MAEALQRRTPGAVRPGALLAAATLLGLPFLAVEAQVQESQGRLYREACDAGNAAACNVLGMMHERGEAVALDLGAAAVLYDRACEGGEPEGCANLGLMYETGLGVPRDLVSAVTLYRRACAAGESFACESLEAIGVDPASDAALPDRFPKRGRVVAAESGMPLADAVVELPGLGVRAVSDTSGHVDLGYLEPGSYALRAERAGYELVDGVLYVPGGSRFEVVMIRGAVDDPLAPGRILGRVTDGEDGRGLSDVDVTVVSRAGARALSDRDGRFALTGLAPGTVALRLSRLGFESRTATVVVHPGLTVELEAALSTDPIELEPVEVTVRSSHLERSGFYRRSDRGLGNHFDRRDLERLDPMRMSDIFWRVPGVSVVQGRTGTRLVSRRGVRGCVMQVFVDGLPSPFDTEDIESMNPDWLEAVEVYRGVGTPIEYGGFDSCGVVLLWTRRGS